MSKLSLKPDVLVLASRLGSHAIHLDALSRLLLKVPVSAVKQVNEGVSRFSTDVDILSRLGI